MLKVTLRSLWAHKRRLVSTVLAIVLGVAFMSGTLVFADTIDKVFEDLFADINEDIDVQVQGEALFDAGFGGPEARQELPVELVDLVRAVDGIERAEPFVQVTGFGASNRVLAPDGEVLGSSQGPPTLLESWIADDVINPYSIAAGRPPEADDEVAMNVGATEDAGIEIGDRVTVVSQLGEAQYEVVGTFTFGEAESAAGAVSVDFTLAEAQRLAGLEGRTQVILAAGDGSVPDEELVARVADALPQPIEVLTGQQAAEQTSDSVQQGFEFFRVLLLLFGTIAVVVGAFIIFNTFSILVAQRTRELALLRAIGAGRRQVLLSVFAEAAVIGVVSAALGLAAGIGLALLVTAAFAAAGADLPTTSLVIGTGTVALAFAIGLGVTLVASVVPAIQATRVPPLAALRDVAVDRAGTSRWRIAIGVLLLGVGAVNLSAAWRSGGDTDSLPAVGTGALLVLVGAIVVGPVLATPTVKLLGTPLPRLRGITGRLARENAARSPKRTSATASALLIGVALVGFITIFGSSAQASVRAEVERGFTGDLIVQSSSPFGPGSGFPPSVADDVQGVDGVASVSRVGFTPAEVTYPDGERSTQFVTVLEAATGLDVFMPRMAEGDLDELTPDGVVVDVGTAEDNDLAIGDEVSLTGPNGRTVSLTVQAISDDLTLIGYWAIDIETWGALVSERQLSQLVLTVEDGQDVAAVQAAVEDVIGDLPGIEVLDREGFIGDLASQITSFLTLVNALLLLSIVIALIGIANTLSLSIHERTRELGLLRAVGMTRAQLRAAVRWEAVIIAVLGTLVGIALGLLTSWALVTALGEFGLGTFSVPFATLAVVVVVAAVLGVLASIRPARRAARLDVLEAIATE